MHSVGTEKKSTTTKNFFVVVLFLLFFFSPARFLFARGGGGGSGGGGGGGGFGGGGGGVGHSISQLPGGNILIYVMTFSFLILVPFVVVWGIYQKKKKIKATSAMVEVAAANDPVWNEIQIIERIKEVFVKFQNDWGNYDIDSMKAYLVDSYWKRMVLELNVLKNEHRQNFMQDVVIYSVVLLSASDSANNTEDTFTAQVTASARDALVDTESNVELYVDSSSFTEYWDFVREGDVWKLVLIRQATEQAALREPAIESFAQKNDFFYDPDFGWLMMPNKGVLFSKSNFGTSDINNHVVGYFRDKIVEFYTFIENPQSRTADDNYVVAQVALPIKYQDILIRRKRPLLNIGPWGLRKIETESNDFNKKFCLWAAPEDEANSFELLAPNFMEKIYDLPFELNIEVVGSFLYFYAKSRSGLDYDKMLEILSWAFDEMKM